MNITILGGTGFVGLNLLNHLAKTKYNVTVITRNREVNKNFCLSKCSTY